MLGLSGEGEEDVVEIRRVHRQALDANPLMVELFEEDFQGPGRAVVRDLKSQGVIVARRFAEARHGSVQSLDVTEVQLDVTARNPAFELVWGTVGDYPTAVEDGDVVGKLVGLLQVLSGEEDGHPGCDE